MKISSAHRKVTELAGASEHFLWCLLGSLTWISDLTRAVRDAEDHPGELELPAVGKQIGN